MDIFIIGYILKKKRMCAAFTPSRGGQIEMSMLGEFIRRCARVGFWGSVAREKSVSSVDAHLGLFFCRCSHYSSGRSLLLGLPSRSFCSRRLDRLFLRKHPRCSGLGLLLGKKSAIGKL